MSYSRSRKLRIASFAVVVGLLVGCSAEQHAKLLVQPDTSPGRIDQGLKGSPEKLLAAGTIDIHRRVATSDGAEIDVWAINARNAQPDGTKSPARGTVVILHEMRKSKGSFPYFGAGQKLAEIGYDVILMDLRAHGRSGGKYVTYGAREKYDVKAVVDSLVGSGELHGDVYVFGAGIGGATAIQYAAVDPRCKGVVALTPYKDFDTIARQWLNALTLTLTESQKLAAIAKAAEIAQFDPAEASAVTAAADVKVPMLLLHGLVDFSVPVEHSEAILAAAGGPKKLQLIIPGEQIALMAIMENWIAEKIDSLATKKLQE